MKKVSFIFGTRPEAIKLSPLILKMKETAELEPHICVTGQHRKMLDQILEVFNIKPDCDLAIMQPCQTLSSLTSKAILKIDKYLSKIKPDLIIVQGDTTSVLCASLAAFYNKIPIAHIEAGLRTWHKYSPFPEEINRVVTTRLADYHFAPTQLSKTNLISEGVSEDRIFVTGNTVIDSLFIALDKINNNPPAISNLPPAIFDKTNNKSLVLITGHRRENFGKGFDDLCKAIAFLAEKFSDIDFVYPVHLNPNVKTPVFKMLSGKNNIHLIEPLSYLPFVYLMHKSTIILTDSGGVQEEAPSLGKPVLVTRENTERPEAVDAGTVKIVGTDPERIINSFTELMTDTNKYMTMTKATNPYGDGNASEKIIEILRSI